MEIAEEGLASEDPQPEDIFLPVVPDGEGRRLLRYRLRSDVLHAYSFKAILARFHLAFGFDQGRQVSFVVELQAKDMLRKRYEFDLIVSGVRSGQVIQPARVLTVDIPA